MRPDGISSVNLVLLLDLEDCPLREPIRGDVGFGDSIVKGGLDRLKRRKEYG